MRKRSKKTLASKKDLVDDLSNGWNTLFESILRMYEKLKQLGFISFEDEKKKGDPNA